VKLLYLPLNVPGSEQYGTVRGFEEVLGKENVRIVDYLQAARDLRDHTKVHEVFYDMVRDFQPEWIHLQAQQTNVMTARSLIYARSLCEAPIVTHWMGDWRSSVSGVLRDICQEADITFVSNEGQLSLYAQAGAKRSVYWQIASDYPEFCELGDLHDLPFRVPEVVFCGNYYPRRFPGSEERLEVVRAFVSSGLDFGVVGGGWPAGIPVIGETGLKEQKHIYMKCKVSVGVNNINNCDRYYSERQLSAMSVPVPHVCWGVPGLEKDFVDGEHCVFYQTPSEAVSKVRALLDDPERARRIGEAGRAEIIQKHLWPERIREILPLVERVRSGLLRALEEDPKPQEGG
jgi:spore maturation protein CgeB